MIFSPVLKVAWLSRHFPKGGGAFKKEKRKKVIFSPVLKVAWLSRHFPKEGGAFKKEKRKKVIFSADLKGDAEKKGAVFFLQQ